VSTAEGASPSPYPGLRPFQSDEEYLFFGRETQVDDLLGRLRRKRFVAVLGTSGSGKSSLVRAGMLPALYGGFMAGNDAQWRVAVMRPGSEPIVNLARALDAAGMLDAIAPDGPLRVGLARAILERGALGLVEIVQQSTQLTGENILIVVDQFEELFRFSNVAGAATSDDAIAFVRLLLEGAQSPSVPIYVVLTMRSDFLGDCSRYRDLPETINDGLFLIPRMNREQLRTAIASPARVAGARIAPRLVTRLLNDLGDDPDELPVLQHALMRTWHLWAERGNTDEALDLADYEATGGMAEALSRHGDEVFAGLPSDESRVLAVRIFKALTERGGDNRGVRRPVRFEELCAIVDASSADVEAVVDAFRAPASSLLMPPADTPLEANTVVDIAHESLMRKWQRLEAWVDEEAQSAQSARMAPRRPAESCLGRALRARLRARHGISRYECNRTRSRATRPDRPPACSRRLTCSDRSRPSELTPVRRVPVRTRDQRTAHEPSVADGQHRTRSAAVQAGRCARAIGRVSAWRGPSNTKCALQHSRPRSAPATDFSRDLTAGL